jgi:uncharacterized low-complexity protein
MTGYSLLSAEAFGNLFQTFLIWRATMISKKNVLTAALGTAFVATLGMTGVANAAQNPFGMQSLDKGYMTADAHMDKDGKAMEAKCGAEKKAAEAKCGAEKKAMESKCGAAKKAHDGKCGAEKKAHEGKCGAAK